MGRTIILDANVVDQISRGNTAAATELRALLRSGATVYVSQQAFNELVVQPELPRTAAANRAFLEDLGIRVAPAGAMASRVDAYSRQPARGGLSEADLRVAAQARSTNAELWSFDRAFRNDPRAVERQFGIQIAPESRINRVQGTSDYRVARQLMQLPPIRITVGGIVTPASPTGGPTGSTGNPPRSGGGAPPPPASPGGSAPPAGRSGGAGARGTTASVGVPDMAPIMVGGPSARGTAAVGGIQLLLEAFNFGANLYIESVQRERATAALRQQEPRIRDHQRSNPTHGALLIFRSQQLQAPPDSLIQPGPVFLDLTVKFGITIDEARSSPGSTLRAGLSPNHREIVQTMWLPPAVQASVQQLRMPFDGVAVATFAEGGWKFQVVEWGGVNGFDDESEYTVLQPAGVRVEFVVLRPPSSIHWLNGSTPYQADLPIITRRTADGSSIEVVDLDPRLPWNASAAMVFPANEGTWRMFHGAPATRDTIGALRNHVNFSRVRWVRPENIRIIRRL